MTLDSRFGLNATDVNDSFYLIGTPPLKEAYDKHGHFYREKDWVKRMHKSISTMSKYKDCVVGSIASYLPFFMIIFFSFGKYTIIGR